HAYSLPQRRSPRSPVYYLGVRFNVGGSRGDFHALGNKSVCFIRRHDGAERSRCDDAVKWLPPEISLLCRVVYLCASWDSEILGSDLILYGGYTLRRNAECADD